MSDRVAALRLRGPPRYAAASPQIDVDGDGNSDFRLTKWAVSQNASLSSKTSGGSIPECPVTVTFDQSVTMSVAASCLGNPSSIRVRHEVYDAYGDGIDNAPAPHGKWSLPVSAGPESGPDLLIVPVHRFWSIRVFENAHFFTVDQREADRIRSTDFNWNDEGEAFHAYAAAAGSCPGVDAVHRFYSPIFQSHFFTEDTKERDQIRSNDPNWTYEGIAFHVLP